MSLPSAGRTWNISDPWSSQTAFIIFTLSRLDTCHFSKALEIYKFGQLHSPVDGTGREISFCFRKQTQMFFCKKSDTTTASWNLASSNMSESHVIDIQLHWNSKPQKNPRPTKPDIQQLHPLIQESPFSGSIKLEDLPIPIDAWLEVLLVNGTTITHMLHVWYISYVFICNIIEFMVNECRYIDIPVPWNTGDPNIRNGLFFTQWWHSVETLRSLLILYHSRLFSLFQNDPKKSPYPQAWFFLMMPCP